MKRECGTVRENMRGSVQFPPVVRKYRAEIITVFLIDRIVIYNLEKFVMIPMNL